MQSQQGLVACIFVVSTAALRLALIRPIIVNCVNFVQPYSIMPHETHTVLTGLVMESKSIVACRICA
jgi:hypothetical protein